MPFIVLNVVKMNVIKVNYAMTNVLAPINEY